MVEAMTNDNFVIGVDASKCVVKNKTLAEAAITKLCSCP
jgi:hypothetical protein